MRQVCYANILKVEIYQKNLYKIEQIVIEWKNIDEILITYTGDGELLTAKKLVVYSNIFQENKLFAREYEDICSELSSVKKTYDQEIKVQLLTKDEIDIINEESFKTGMKLTKFKKIYRLFWLLIIKIK